MMLWKIVSGFSVIAGGFTAIIIILAACIWVVAGVINWLLEHSFAEVFGCEEEVEVPLREKIPTPPPIPRGSAKDRPPMVADFRVYADKVATSYGSELRPKEVWVVDNGHSKVAWSNLWGALDSVPDGKSFIVFDKTGKTIQYGVKDGMTAYL